MLTYTPRVAGHTFSGIESLERWPGLNVGVPGLLVSLNLPESIRCRLSFLSLFLLLLLTISSQSIIVEFWN